MSEYFEQLESNKKDVVALAKQKILDQFGNVKDSWLLNGLYDYYLSTNSTNAIVILVNIREPHGIYLFDRLSDSIGKNAKPNTKVQALTLLGHILRHQPMWLYKLPEHQLLKDLLKLLKMESEILPLMSALLVLIVLIPMIPSSFKDCLNDVFEIFSRLASWNFNPGKVVDDQICHLQVALYALFLRLYGMFPCNFLTYLRSQYKDKNKPVFVHTIKPMLESVKMNPSLVTTPKDSETASERWKKKAVHDIIVECEQFSLDTSDTFCAHDSCQLASGFRSRSGTMNSALETSYFSLKNLASSMTGNERVEYFTPSTRFNPDAPPITGIAIPTFIPQTEFTHDENIIPAAGSSPPEAAIEATPETTPILQENSQLAKTPTQPQSPFKKDKSLFTFPPENRSISDDQTGQSSGLEKSQVSAGSLKYQTPPPSPLRPKPVDSTRERALPKSSPTKSIGGSSIGADEEIIAIERRESGGSQPVLKQSDSLSQENEEAVNGEHSEQDRSSPCTAGGLHMPNSKSMKDFAQRVRRLRHHSQCTTEPEQMRLLMEDVEAAATGNDSRNNNGSSPDTEGTGRGSGDTTAGSSNRVRRANSCPEMKKSPASSIKDNISRITLDVTDEEENNGGEEETTRAGSAMSNGGSGLMIDSAAMLLMQMPNQLVSKDTQTENFWPMPYEHLFLNIFPTLGITSNDSKTTTAATTTTTSGISAAPDASPGPQVSSSSAPGSASTAGSSTSNNVSSTGSTYNYNNVYQEKSIGSQQQQQPSSVYDILDKYLESAMKSNDKDNAKILKNQLQLMHQQLLFERHRRNMHAFKNRRFFGDTKTTNSLEEHNSALRDQVQLQQRDIDNLRRQLKNVQRERESENRTYNDVITRLEDQCKSLAYKNKALKETETINRKELEVCNSEFLSLMIEKQKIESSLQEALVEVKFAKEKALAGDKGREELEYVNKQILLMGELQEKYEQRLEDAQTLRRSDVELEMYKAAVSNEIQTLHQSLNDKKVRLDACLTRIAELEALVAQREETICKQKRILNSINEENDEKVKAVENKYQNLLVIVRTMEQKTLELCRQIEVLQSRKLVRSPDTSSCQEVKVLTSSSSTSGGGGIGPNNISSGGAGGGGAAGVSQRSSPLSCSLASSEGSSTLPPLPLSLSLATAATTDNVVVGGGGGGSRDMKGLQANLGEESPSDTKPGTPKEFDLQPPSASSKPTATTTD